MIFAAKDAIASKAAQAYLNDLIRRYGTVQRLKIDSRNSRMEAVCLLNGEAEPISVEVSKYVIINEGPKRFIQVAACSCSRPWVQALLRDFAEGRRVELPPWAAAAL